MNESTVFSCAPILLFHLHNLLSTVRSLSVLFSCRYPLPEQYTLTMEIVKDRTTKASVEVCSSSSKSGSGSGCPEAVAPGDKFLRRTLNEPCQKMVYYTV